MKHRKIFSIVLMLGALLWPTSFAPSALGQPEGKRLIVNSGVIALGGGQILRLTINGQAGNDAVMVRFRRMYYTGSANGGVWKSSIAAQDLSDTTTLAANEAVSADISQGGFGAVRIEAIIRGYTGTTHVNGGVLQIINSDGTVVAFLNSFPSE